MKETCWLIGESPRSPRSNTAPALSWTACELAMAERRTFSKFRAFVDLKCLAASALHEAMVGTTFVRLERGAAPVSVRSLARRWNWSNEKVSRAELAPGDRAQPICFVMQKSRC